MHDIKVLTGEHSVKVLIIGLVATLTFNLFMISKSVTTVGNGMPCFRFYLAT